MIEPVAYLVSQEPLSSVRWLSDVKPIGVDDKQITPLYTADQLHPTVEMTEIQKYALVEFKENWAFTQFINAVEGNYENNMYFKKVEEAFLKMRINNGYMIDENELMQAWLQPENIKVVDE